MRLVVGKTAYRVWCLVWQAASFSTSGNEISSKMRNGMWMGRRTRRTEYEPY